MIATPNSLIIIHQAESDLSTKYLPAKAKVVVNMGYDTGVIFLEKKIKSHKLWHTLDGNIKTNIGYWIFLTIDSELKYNIIYEY